MDHLPPTVTDNDLLALLGKLLEVEPTSQSTGDIRLRFFQPRFSWQALVDLAVAHEVLPPLVFALQQRCLLPPLPTTLSEEARAAHVTSRLSATYKQHLDWRADLQEQLKMVTAALNSKGIIPLLLKGSVHLTKAQPPWHEARGMRDIDILVPAPEAHSAYHALLSLGYRSDGDPGPIDRHLPELRHPRRVGAIEIHTEALSFSARHALTTEEVFDRAELQIFDGMKLKILSPEWHLLHGLLHHQLSDRGYARRVLAIKGLWEFSRVGADVSPKGWCAIIDHAEKREFLAVLASWTIQANRLFELSAPGKLLDSEAGRRHAEATFKHARRAYLFRQAGFVADRLRLAFAPETLALRYRLRGNAGPAALRHVGFLLRRRVEGVKGFISFGDVHEVIRLASLGFLAWTLPETMWWPISRLLGRLNVAMHPKRTRFETAQIARLLSGTGSEGDLHRINMENWARRYEARFQYLRSWRPGSWNPQIRIVGSSNVAKALDKGNGLIFWGGNFSFNDLVAKMAMHRLGLAVSGFSVPVHGLSKTPFGIRYLNRICRDIENRYLGERLMVEPQEFSSALRHLRDCLEDNKPIYFAVGGRARRTVSAKFLGGRIILPTGPLAMAHETGATILPVHTFRKAPGRFEVTFGPSIEFPRDSDGHVDYAGAAQAYADMLGPVVLRDPGQWCGWHLIRSWNAWGLDSQTEVNQRVFKPWLTLPFRRILTRRVPTAFITGTKGKTTTTRMLTSILSQAGFIVGFTSTDGVVIGGELISDRDLAGYAGARRVLKDRSITAAVLEVARGGLLRHGLYIDRCDVAALLNVGREQIGIDGVETVEQMAQVKRKVIEAAQKAVVLNADNQLCRKLISEFPVDRTVLFSANPKSTVIKRHLRQGGVAFCLEESGKPQIVRLQGKDVHTVISIADLPSAWGGVVRHNIANAMAAAALADGLGIASEFIQSGLRAFDITIEQSPGRFNIIRGYPFLIIVDRAMDPPAAEALAECLELVALEGRRICMLTCVGNRPSWHYREFIRVLARRFDHFVCYEQESYRRGRAPGEIAGLLKSELLRHGVEAKSIDIADDYESALRALTSKPKQGDLVVVLGMLKEKDISVLSNAFASSCGFQRGDRADDLIRLNTAQELRDQV